MYYEAKINKIEATHISPALRNESKDKKKMTRTTELKALTRRKLNIIAKGLGLKFNGSKPDLIEKIYEIENSTRNERIDQMFKRIADTKHNSENTSDLTSDKRMKNKRKREEDVDTVSNKYPKTMCST